MMYKARALVMAGAVISMTFACGADKGSLGNSSNGNNGGSGGGGGRNGTQFADALLPGSNGGGTGTQADDDTCGQQNFNLQRLPPEVILVQDKSGSMIRDANGGLGTPTRWSEAIGALSEVLTNTQASVHWGLQLYPTCVAGNPPHECLPTPCTVSGGNIAPAANQARSINETVAAARPRLDTGATPTAEAVRIATQALRARTTPNPKFILLSTDGQPNCRNFPGGTTGAGENDPEGALQAVQAAVAAGIDVFVVGFATASVVAAHNSLNEMAVAGRRPLDGPTRYYSVSSRAQLVAALSNIASAVQDCTFNLTTTPPGNSTVVVEIDNVRLQANQWTWGAGRTSITVGGEACTRLRNGTARNAVIKWRCDGLEID